MALIIDAIRTPIGKMGGALKHIEAHMLAAHVLTAIVDKTSIDANSIDEVIFGQGKQSTDAPNIARVATLQAKLPIHIPAYTVHRQCGSGGQAIHNAAMQIQAGLADIIIAGGVESMSTAPYYIRQARYGYGAGNGMLLDPNTESQPRSQPIDQYGTLTMGDTAENVARQYNISRKEQDRFADRSQTLAAQAIAAGHFESQITGIPLQSQLFTTDEHPYKTSVDVLATLSPVFQQDGTVTAGNSSGRNDGAAALLIASEQAAKMHGLTPRARIIAQAAAGVSPTVMGIAPVEATKKALRLANLTLRDIEVIELNEAFAAQALAVISHWDVPLERINVNGGAIALGHPIGATGAILMTKLLYELERRSARYGLVTVCIAGGLGIATIVENLRL